jgi:hypothetical protein
LEKVNKRLDFSHVIFDVEMIELGTTILRERLEGDSVGEEQICGFGKSGFFKLYDELARGIVNVL